MTTSKYNHSALSNLTARVLLPGLASAVLALTGCAIDMELDDEAQAPEMVEYSPDIIGAFQTRHGGELTFTVEYESGDGTGDPVVAMTELRPERTPSYLDYLRSQGATSLEAFLAIAPDDTEIPALLHTAHAREVALTKRSADIRALSLASMPEAKTSDSSTCDSYAAFTSNVSSWLSEQTASSTATHWLSYQNGGNVLAAMCNRDSNRVDYKYAQFCYEVTVQGSNLGLLYCDSKILVPDGHRADKVWFSATTDRVVRAEKLANYSLTVSSYIAIGGLPPIP